MVLWVATASRPLARILCLSANFVRLLVLGVRLVSVLCGGIRVFLNRLIIVEMVVDRRGRLLK